jgi:hypothetical protein
MSNLTCEQAAEILRVAASNHYSQSADDRLNGAADVLEALGAMPLPEEVLALFCNTLMDSRAP